ncbi:MAG: hypothetical protein AB7L13_10460 [Acidimicrobiia bacterium]
MTVAPSRALVAAVVSSALIIAACSGGGSSNDQGAVASSAVASGATTTAKKQQGARDVKAYEGLGGWVDVFDYVPAYQRNNTAPPVTEADIDAMAAQGVKTLYLQAARNALDTRTPDGLVDPALFLPLLKRAHEKDMRVVGWYFPGFVDVQSDLDRLQKIADFSRDGERFDGLALDVEPEQSTLTLAERSVRLVDLSRRLRDAVGREALALILNPPVLTEVINTKSWPDFPYKELAPLFDVWMPMAYWSGREQSSGYRDGYTYAEESVRRLRNNLGQPNAKVHLIGGVAEEGISEDQLRAFLRAVTDTDAIGASIYDYRSMSGGEWGVMRLGIKAALDAPPQPPNPTVAPKPTTTTVAVATTAVAGGATTAPITATTTAAPATTRSAVITVAPTVPVS